MKKSMLSLNLRTISGYIKDYLRLFRLYLFFLYTLLAGFDFLYGALDPFFVFGIYSPICWHVKYTK